jgi:thioesterase domain-containing protein/acyl carrier protein
LKDFPLTTNGKVDRKALPDADIALQQQAYVAPTTDTEHALCEIWQEVLGIERVGINDDFFSIGGNSLLVTRLVYEINQRLSSQLSVRNIFEYPELGQLSNLLVSLNAESNDETYILCNNAFNESLPTFFLLPPLAGEWGDVNAIEKAAKQRFNLVMIQQYCADMTNRESVCDYFIKQIKTFNIDGPIIIGGYSQGGVWAYDVAKQLYSSGMDIAQVVILDSLAPGNFDNLANDEITEIVGSQLRRANVLIERELSLSLDSIKIDLQRSLPSMPEAYINQLVERINFADRNMTLSRTVEFDKAVELPVVYFATNKNSELDINLKSWEENNKLMRIIEVPVDHNNMLTAPYVDTLFTQIIDNI